MGHSKRCHRNNRTAPGARVYRWCRRFLEADSGNVLMLTAFGLMFLCGLLALSVDAGRILFTQRELQTLADAAALAGAAEIGACNGTSDCSAMQAAASSALRENGATGITVVTQCGSSNASGLILMVNNGPCMVGASDPANNNTSYVEAVVSLPVPTIFLSVLGRKSITVKARSEAGGTKPKYCAYILSPSASNALLFNGNATFTASCGIIDDSSATPAAVFNGNDNISATALDIVGTDINNGNNSLSPAPHTGATSEPDPLSSLPAPTIGACGSSTSSPYSGSANQVVVNGGNNNAQFGPGVYCGGITINGNSSATFSAGTYIIKGPMIVNGGDTVSGSGVTLYFTNSGSLTMNGNSHMAFSAPTSGTYAGILYFQDRSDSTAVIINGDTTSSWQGAIYASDAQLTLNGNGNVAAYSFLVVNTLIENGHDTFRLGNDYSSLTNGSPIKKHLLTHMVE